MSLEIESKLEKIPVVNLVVSLLKKVKLKAFEGLSLYDLLEMYILGILKGALSMRASAVSYSLFMALFPFLIFLLSLIPFIDTIPFVEEGSFRDQFLLYLDSALPATSADFFSEIFEDIRSRRSGSLLSTTFLLSIFLIANGVNAIFGSFENSYHVQISRNFIRQYMYSFIIGLLLTLVLIFAVVMSVWYEVYVVEYVSELAGKTIGTDVDKGDSFGVLIGKIMFFFGLTYMSTAILYFFGTTEGRKGKFFSAGALLTSILFMLTFYLFGIYIDNFSKYNELYGAIGGMLILMVYIWLNSNLLLLGFELNASLRKLKFYHKEENYHIDTNEEELSKEV